MRTLQGLAATALFRCLALVLSLALAQPAFPAPAAPVGPRPAEKARASADIQAKSQAPARAERRAAPEQRAAPERQGRMSFEPTQANAPRSRLSERRSAEAQASGMFSGGARRGVESRITEQNNSRDKANRESRAAADSARIGREANQKGQAEIGRGGGRISERAAAADVKRVDPRGREAPKSETGRIAERGGSMENSRAGTERTAKPEPKTAESRGMESRGGTLAESRTGPRETRTAEPQRRDSNTSSASRGRDAIQRIESRRSESASAEGRLQGEAQSRARLEAQSQAREAGRTERVAAERRSQPERATENRRSGSENRSQAQEAARTAESTAKGRETIQRIEARRTETRSAEAKTEKRLAENQSRAVESKARETTRAASERKVSEAKASERRNSERKQDTRRLERDTRTADTSKAHARGPHDSRTSAQASRSQSPEAASRGSEAIQRIENRRLAAADSASSGKERRDSALLTEGRGDSEKKSGGHHGAPPEGIRQSQSASEKTSPNGSSTTLKGEKDFSSLQSKGDYVVTFMGDNAPRFYDRADATLGPNGGTVWVAPLEDVADVSNRAKVVTATGHAPGALNSYMTGKPIYGIAVPRDALQLRQPTATDAGANRHFREGGFTGVEYQGIWKSSNVREWVTQGGMAVPKGTVFFEFNPDGSWTEIRKW